MAVRRKSNMGLKMEKNKNWLRCGPVMVTIGLFMFRRIALMFVFGAYPNDREDPLLFLWTHQWNLARSAPFFYCRYYVYITRKEIVVHFTSIFKKSQTTTLMLWQLRLTPWVFETLQLRWLVSHTSTKQVHLELSENVMYQTYKIRGGFSVAQKERKKVLSELEFKIKTWTVLQTS